MGHTYKNKTTARDWQRSLFIGSLSEQLEKMASATGKIEEEMQGYLDEGMSPTEAEELLMAEGHDIDIVKSCSCKMSEVTQEPDFKWGYRIGDNNGRIFSHIELEETIEASSYEDAENQLKQIISDSGADSSFRDIIEIFKLD